ncbi:hypothetical protein [Kitasatospora sp. NPDC101183]|uniref:hypothetical protein n=1 Tax=Kitasatospora sp. NPDC101183 TaxID=3364100 RepID=UPI0038002417
MDGIAEAEPVGEGEAVPAPPALGVGAVGAAARRQAEASAPASHLHPFRRLCRVDRSIVALPVGGRRCGPEHYWSTRIR